MELAQFYDHVSPFLIEPCLTLSNTYRHRFPPPTFRLAQFRVGLMQYQGILFSISIFRLSVSLIWGKSQTRFCVIDEYCASTDLLELVAVGTQHLGCAIRGFTEVCSMVVCFHQNNPR